MEKIETERAPKVIGPYSQAVVAGDYLFVSGQIALDPSTGNLVEGGIKEQTKRVLENIGAILASAGTGFGKVVKTSVFLKDMADFAEMNDVYAGLFLREPKPARETVQVAALPKGAKIEISCIAYLGK